MKIIARRLLRMINKRAVPHPSDLPNIVALDELAGKIGDLHFNLGPTLEDRAAGDLLDSITFATLVLARQPRTFFEIGTGFGRTATLTALHAPAATIHTLSLPNNPATGRIFHGKPWADRITQLEGDSATFDYQPWQGKMDFVFVDGWHKSPVVEADTANAFKLVGRDGWIVWHDAAEDDPDVLRALLGCGHTGITWIRGTRYALWRAPAHRPS